MKLRIAYTALAVCAAALPAIPEAALAASPAARADASEQTLHDKAVGIQKQIVTFDNHLDLPFDYAGAGTDGPAQFDLPKAERGLLKGASFAIFVPQGPRTSEDTANAREQAQKKYEIIAGIAKDNPGRAAVAYSPDDVKRIEASGKFAVVFSILNGNAIGEGLSQFDEWYKKGVRIVGFNHAGNNDLSDSSRPNLLRGDKLDEHGGLSDLGKQAVTRLNDLGVVIDVSQLSGKALIQVLSLTRAPVVASHSNARAIVDHPRNLSDEQLLAIKKNGGVVAVNAFSSWISPLPADIQQKANQIRSEYQVPTEQNIAALQPLTEKGLTVLPSDKYEEYNTKFHALIMDPANRATLSEYVDQIDYVVKKIGIDHVGISSDFNHGGGVVGWSDESEATNVTAELLKRGYKEKDIAKLWGGNFLRIWDQVRHLAKK